MSQWSFVIAAYGLTGLVSAGLALFAWLAMKAAEKQ